jgi:undecaprenyl diphosphate synthase
LKKKLTSSDFIAIEQLKKKGNIPSHIAIIMDGNGRWAKKRGLPRAAGHKKGVETVRDMVQACSELGVKYLTLYTFSTENWKRPQEEVTTLMRLIVKSLKDETDDLNANNVKLTTIGDSTSLPKIVQQELEQALMKTSGNTKLVLNLALSYSSRWELINVVKNISKQVKENKLSIDEIDENVITANLETRNMPDPDLLVRSGGEYRVSNFLLWQLAYAELYISEVLWPDFKTKNLLEAITSYQNRERRFGQVSEQILKQPKKNNNAKTS